MDPRLSLIIPVYNEAENIRELFEKIKNVMKPLGGYECLFIDDGSTDGSAGVIRELKKTNPQVRLISFRRNFGQTAAMSAGFDRACGEILVTLDADLQNDPADIPKLLEKMNEGYDVVSGWRKKRRDPLLKKIPSFFANKLISEVTGVRLHDSGCTLKAYRKSAVEGMRLYGQMHRFIPALLSYKGVSLAEVVVEHWPRTKGRSNYGISRTLRVLFDLITVKFLLSYSTSPIQIFGKVGLFSAFSGAVFFIVAVFLKFSQGRTLTGNPLFYFFIFMEMTSLQFILIGLLAEVNIRTYHESQGKKTYVIKEIV